jgi:6-phosphogluconolactonase/glucosamine-6-phosphate isomerase/deaminase
MVSGREKAEAVRDVLGETGAASRLPAGLVKPHDGEVIWLIDEGAAELIRDAG